MRSRASSTFPFLPLSLSLAFALVPVACTVGGESSPPPGGASGTESAAAKFPDMDALWGGSIARTCGPNNGVCHQNKQYPHMELSTSLGDGIGARCNQLVDRPEVVANLCEPPGDRLRVGAFETRIANIHVEPKDAPVEIHVVLKDPIPAGALDAMPPVSIVRSRPGYGDVLIPIPPIDLAGAKDGALILAYGNTTNHDLSPHPTNGYYSLGNFLMPNAYVIQGADDQVELGDPNADGVFGAELGGATIVAGDPAKSMLFLRVIDALPKGGDRRTNMKPSDDAYAQMPLANRRHWDEDDSVIALYCWIKGLRADRSNVTAPIDYAGCDLSAMPAIRHQGGEASTFSSIYEGVLSASCSRCHGGDKPAAGLALDDRETAYARLLGTEGAGPTETSDMPFVTPNDPARSWLVIKLRDKPPAGDRMPQGGEIAASSIDAIEQWIAQGAQHN